MISSKDRSGYIGASDTGMVMRSWKTKTFEQWWRIKQGITVDDYSSVAMKTGAAYEHKILDSLSILGLEKDKQIIKGRLRVNLDGNTEKMIYEVKTHSAEKPFRVSADYRRQVNVEMFALGVHNAEIVAYALEPEDYRNWHREIDANRITHHPIEYDEEFISAYIPRMNYLCRCLETGKFPKEEEVLR